MGQNSFWAFVVRFEATGFAVANMVVERNRGVAAPFWILVALLAGLAVAYLLPLNRIPGSPAIAGAAQARSRRLSATLTWHLSTSTAP